MTNMTDEACMANRHCLKFSEKYAHNLSRWNQLAKTYDINKMHYDLAFTHLLQYRNQSNNHRNGFVMKELEYTLLNKYVKKDRIRLLNEPPNRLVR